MWLVLVFPSDTVISTWLPDSASVFIADVSAITKALEQTKDSVASKYISFTDLLLCLHALQHMKLKHPLIEMVIRKCIVLNLASKDIYFFGYRTILVLGAMKRQTLLPSLPWICQYILSTCYI